ncbi:hypothetical protein CC79DRAFT_1394119 [Sarocladium strictum]
MHQALRKHACSICARRKVKCNRTDPCSNCARAQVHCTYEDVVLHRPRKRAADQELLDRLARYETLMREHKIDFGACANVWVPSGLEQHTPEEVEDGIVTDPESRNTPLQHNDADGGLRSLWMNLAPQLKHPPMQNLAHKEDPCWVSTPPLHDILSDPPDELHNLRPAVKHIFKLWDVFVQSVNPLTKILHVPTVQSRILGASWEADQVPKPLCAVMFAVCTLSVTAMSTENCLAVLGEARSDLILRYRSATVRALLEADLFTTTDTEVLQALALFLLADPDSDLSSTLVGTAIRIGQRVGLDREATYSKLSVFERELRIRLWWQVCAIEGRIRTPFVAKPKFPQTSLGDIRKPLNVNDADLHPDMVEEPAEIDGPTEMTCVLMKYSVFSIWRSSTRNAGVFENIFQATPRQKALTTMENSVIQDIKNLFEHSIYRLDPSIPLHGLAHAMAQLYLARLRFKVLHPRNRPQTNGQVYMSQDDSDALFDSAVTIMDKTDFGLRSKLSPHMFLYMTSKVSMDHVIYILSELCQRCTGDKVHLAWRLIENLFNDHPELLHDEATTFAIQLGKLTIDAWQAYRSAAWQGEKAFETQPLPTFVQRLWERESMTNMEVPVNAATDLDEHSLGDGAIWIDQFAFPWDSFA